MSKFKWLFFTLFVTSPSCECQVTSLSFGSSIPATTRWSQFIHFMHRSNGILGNYQTKLLLLQDLNCAVEIRRKLAVILSIGSMLFGQVLTEIIFPDCGKVLCLAVIWVWPFLCSSEAEIITIQARRHHLKSHLGLVQLYHAAGASTKSTFTDLQDLIWFKLFIKVIALFWWPSIIH